MARSFDGTNDYLSGTVATTATTNISMATWLNITTFDGLSDVVYYNGSSSSNGWGLYYWHIAGDMIILLGGSATLDPAVNFSATGWNHWAFTRSTGATWQMYKNGATYGSAMAGTPSAPATSIIIGGSSGAGERLPKQQAESAIWTRVLEADEIAALADGYSPEFFPRNRVHYVPLWGTSSPEPDLSQGLNLTLNGAPGKADHPRTIYSYARQNKYKSSAAAVGRIFKLAGYGGGLAGPQRGLVAKPKDMFIPPKRIEVPLHVSR